MLIKHKGILNFYPKDVTKKHKKQSSWKSVAIIETKCDLDSYYSWFLKKRFNLNLNKNLRGSHITIINDKVDKEIFNLASKTFHGKEIDFYLELEPKTNGKHWWFRAFSPDSESIRESIGLDKDPYFGLHFTIGLVNDLNLAHSDYILKICKFHNLTSSEPRKDLIFYDEIIDFSKYSV
jgi:hypothetical protein